ncbi:hypothetical protein C8Q72DRAFT_882300 [Fomitopsis betulina]|nr:hypothetical protein C8Q72DRAFT_882300 [Fomitopsis betulina]
MTFLNHTHSLLVLVWLAFAPVLVVATGLQDQTFGINNSAVLFSTGWSTVSNAAGTFRETTGKANEVEIFLPAGTVTVFYVGFKQTGGALYAVCLDCGTSGQLVRQINASDPMADTSPAVLFSYSGLNPSTSHTLQVVNGVDAAFDNTSTLTFKEVVTFVNVTSTSLSSTATTSSVSSKATSSSTTSSHTTSSASSIASSTNVSTSTTSHPSSASATTATTAAVSPPLVSITTSSIPASSTATTTSGSLSRSGLSTGTIIAAVVSSVAAVLLLFALAIFLLYRARNRQLRADSESIASGMGLTRQISAPSIVAVPFEVPPPRSATAAIFNRSSMANNVRRRSYLTDSARGMAAAAAAIQTDGDASSMSSVPARPRNPYEGVVRPDLPIDYPGHMPNSPRTPGSGRQRGMYR